MKQVLPGRSREGCEFVAQLAQLVNERKTPTWVMQTAIGLTQPKAR